MTNLTQPLREEHKELLPEIEALRQVADQIGTAPLLTLREQIDAAYDFLAHHLIPHAEAEEKALYPAVVKVMGAPEATATMSRGNSRRPRITRSMWPLVNGSKVPG